jgi:nucleoside-diphosphate-sugar epimerase
MKVFVTGATGFLGSAVTRTLLAHGHTVVALARSPTSASKVKVFGASPLIGNLTDLALLTKAAEDCDAVIHTAFHHDFLSPSYDFPAAAREDREALQALVDGVRGTNKPIVAANGLPGGKPNTILLETDEKGPGPRTGAEELFKKAAGDGVRGITIRLGPSVHGDGDYAFIPTLIDGARKNGFAMYVDENAFWSPVHRDDAAELFRLAIEKDLPGGTVLHGSEDPACNTKNIAEVIARKVGVEVKQVTKQEAMGLYGFIGMAFGTYLVGSNELTKKLTGWEVQQKGLLADLEEGTYFSTPGV